MTGEAGQYDIGVTCSSGGASYLPCGVLMAFAPSKWFVLTFSTDTSVDIYKVAGEVIDAFADFVTLNADNLVSLPPAKVCSTETNHCGVSVSVRFIGSATEIDELTGYVSSGKISSEVAAHTGLTPLYIKYGNSILYGSDSDAPSTPSDGTLHPAAIAAIVGICVAAVAVVVLGIFRLRLKRQS